MFSIFFDGDFGSGSETLFSGYLTISILIFFSSLKFVILNLEKNPFFEHIPAEILSRA